MNKTIEADVYKQYISSKDEIRLETKYYLLTKLNNHFIINFGFVCVPCNENPKTFRPTIKPTPVKRL